MADFAGQFKSNKIEWETPDDLFEKLSAEFSFTLDVCANSENKKVDRYFSEEQDGLLQEWNGVCWMNPPFNNKRNWVKKAYAESQKGNTVVALLPARTNTNWWHDYCMKGEIRFIRGRVKFKGAKHGLPQPLAIVVFRGKETK